MWGDLKAVAGHYDNSGFGKPEIIFVKNERVQ